MSANAGFSNTDTVTNGENWTNRQYDPDRAYQQRLLAHEMYGNQGVTGWDYGSDNRDNYLGNGTTRLFPGNGDNHGNQNDRTGDGGPLHHDDGNLNIGGGNRGGSTVLGRRSSFSTMNANGTQNGAASLNQQALDASNQTGDPYSAVGPYGRTVSGGDHNNLNSDMTPWMNEDPRTRSGASFLDQQLMTSEGRNMTQAQVDAKYGKAGTPERTAAEEKLRQDYIAKTPNSTTPGPSYQDWQSNMFQNKEAQASKQQGYNPGSISYAMMSPEAQAAANNIQGTGSQVNNNPGGYTSGVPTTRTIGTPATNRTQAAHAAIGTNTARTNSATTTGASITAPGMPGWQFNQDGSTYTPNTTTPPGPPQQDSGTAGGGGAGTQGPPPGTFVNPNAGGGTNPGTNGGTGQPPGPPAPGDPGAGGPGPGGGTGAPVAYSLTEPGPNIGYNNQTNTPINADAVNTWNTGGASGNRQLAGGRMFGSYSTLVDHPELDAATKNAITQNGMNATRANFAGASGQIDRQVAATGNSAGSLAAKTRLATSEGAAIGQQGRQNQIDFENARMQRLNTGLQGLGSLYKGESDYMTNLFGQRQGLSNAPLDTQTGTSGRGNVGSFNFGAGI